MSQATREPQVPPSQVRTNAALILVSSAVNAAGTGAYLAVFLRFLTTDRGIPAELVGLSLGIGAAAGIALAPATAAIAGALSPRRALVLGHLLRMGLLMGLALGTPSAPVGACTVAVIMLVDRSAFPWSTATMLDSLPAHTRGSMLGLRQSIGWGSQTLGAGIAAAVVGVHGSSASAAVVFANAASFGVSAVLLACLRPIGGAPTTVRETPRGWRSVDARVWPLVALAAIFALGETAVTVGVPVAFSQLDTGTVAACVTVYLGAAAVVQGLVGVARDRSRDLAVPLRVSTGASVVLGLLGVVLGLQRLPHLSLLGAAALGVAVAAAGGAFAVFLRVTDMASLGDRNRLLAAHGLSGSVQRLIGPPLVVVLAAHIAGWFFLPVAVLLLCANVVTGRLLRRPLPHEGVGPDVTNQ